MKSILRDPQILNLASRCAALAREIGIQRPAASFVEAASFAVAGEDRLCLGAVELELLGKREELLKAVCKARNVDIKRHHLDRLAREYGDHPIQKSHPVSPTHQLNHP